MATIRDKIIDYRLLIEKSTADFVGRGWAIKEVDSFLAAASPRNYLFLGEPGSGKTTLLAYLVKERGYLHHFIGAGSLSGVDPSFTWRDPLRFAESVGYQLVRDYGGWVMDWESWGIHVEQKIRVLQGLAVAAEIDDYHSYPRSLPCPSPLADPGSRAVRTAGTGDRDLY